MSVVRERRRCPLKSWGPFGGNDFWGNLQEGAIVLPCSGHFARSSAPEPALHLFEDGIARRLSSRGWRPDTARSVQKERAHIAVCSFFLEPASSYSPGPASLPPDPQAAHFACRPGRYGARSFSARVMARDRFIVHRTSPLRAPLKRSRVWAGHGPIRAKRKSTHCCVLFLFGTGIVILSRAVSSQVPSALMSLTSVFGMRTGGTSSP